MELVATIILALASVVLAVADGPISRRRERDKLPPTSPFLGGLAVAASAVAVLAAVISVLRAFDATAEPGDDLAIAVTFVAFVAFVGGFVPALVAVRPSNPQTWGTWAATLAFLASGVLLVVGARSDLVG